MEVNMDPKNFKSLLPSQAKKKRLISLSSALSLLSMMVIGLSPQLLPAGAAPTASGAAAAVKPSSDKPADKKETKPAPEVVIENVVNVQPETLVDHPSEYLNKNIRFTAQFFNYNNLAVDYKPAMRSSKNYLSFSVLREHSKVPLSELKLAMVNPKDEKDPLTNLLLKLKEKDEIEVTGKVFATALDEPWVDVLKLKLIKAAPDEKKPEGGSLPAKEEEKKK